MQSTNRSAKDFIPEDFVDSKLRRHGIEQVGEIMSELCGPTQRTRTSYARAASSFFLGLLAAHLGGCALSGSGPPSDAQSVASPQFELRRVIEVAGRQGVSTDGEHYFVSSSTALFSYSKSGELLASNEEALKPLPFAANHIGDISHHGGEIFAAVEYFLDGAGRDLQIAVYDADSLEFRRSIAMDPDSRQVEASAVSVDAEQGLLWVTDWVDGRYLYRYSLDGSGYRGRLVCASSGFSIYRYE